DLKLIDLPRHAHTLCELPSRSSSLPLAQWRYVMKSGQSVSTEHQVDVARRDFLRGSAGAAALGLLGSPLSSKAQQANEWNQGQLAHLIPAASHERFLIKASFKTPLGGTPKLSIDGKTVDAVRTDTQGRFWRFDATGLWPATQYELRIADAGGAPLCD